MIRKFSNLFMVVCLLSASSCATLDQSLRLGGALGTFTGAGAVYACESSHGETPSLQNVALGSAIGFGVGLLTSYLVHKAVVAERVDTSEQVETYFGDLPPSPFVIPNLKSQKRGAR